MKHVNRIYQQGNGEEGGDDDEYKKLNWFVKWLGFPSHAGCELTYKDCFYSYSLLHLEDNQQIDQQQFDELIYAVYYDLKQHNPHYLNLFDWMVRKHYDTPFWNGRYREIDPNDPDKIQIKPRNDTVVCFGSTCYKRSDVNYFAQGMWGAAMQRTLEQTINIARDYKANTYHGVTLSLGAEYWIQFGYETYQALDANPITP